MVLLKMSEQVLVGRGGWKARTLWLLEDVLLDTSLESSVEQGVEHGINSLDVVVGLDILLEGDAAVRELAWRR